MNEKLLICDDTASLGRFIASRFINMGITSECCRGNLSVIQESLRNGRYKGILLFASRPDDKLLSFISDAKSMGISVFAGLYISLSGVQKSFLEAGAALCFNMPCSVSKLCRTVMLRLDKPDALLPAIEVFLEENSFPRQLSGFCYLAKACELCMLSPDRLWGGMGGIYQEVALHFSASSSVVERSLRTLGEKVSLSGALSRMTEHRLSQKPTNTELICAVCDAISRL